jgi:hypothetical protein
VLGVEAAPTQSELEDLVLDLILRGGFVHPAVNEPLLIRITWEQAVMHPAATLRRIAEAGAPRGDD